MTYWFAVWYDICGSIPYWPSLVLSLYWSIKSSKDSDDSLKFRMRLLAAFLLLGILLDVLYWSPMVMEW